MAEQKPTDPKGDARFAQMEAEMAQLRVLLAQMQSAQPGVEAIKTLAERSAPANNPNYNPISPFTHPEGDRVRPKAKLSRETYFCGARQREDELTPAEIDLFNAFDKSTTLVKPFGEWKAQIVRDGTVVKLLVDVPAGSVDARMSLPSLSAILGELLTGDVQHSKEDMIAALQAKVIDLERRMVAA